MLQEITSAKTSTNQLPAILRLIDQTCANSALFWAEHRTVLDYGGGRYDKLTHALADRGVLNLIYDPFNREKVHNDLVRQIFTTRGHKARVSVCSNVLNVISEPEIRSFIMRDIGAMTSDEGVVFFTVYEGDRSSKGRLTSKGWQENRPTQDYLHEIRELFETVSIKGKLIWAQELKS